ncbi:replication initiator protein A [Fusibacter tunisiensis]|uniref:Replication initiator A N-terminal domain-containing protein n=1 Tax=Fusibacter tunisiensis TaxID=1008308 RepID=A0ABS2MSW7_9FIRM|nr:replication initiator protein A [Fusibacter tunisiensis]MBM7562526.1 hypothetical protein [Fusibacter tunisiensis]
MSAQKISNQFLQLPRCLFDSYYSSLSNNAKILYAILKDRLSLSEKNGWKDERGETYIVYTRKNMQAMLGVTDKTLKKAILELEEAGLFEEKRTGLNKANRIYIKMPNLNSGHEKIPSQEPEKTPSQESEKFRPNYTDSNKLKLVSKTSSLSLEEIKKQINYDSFDDEEINTVNAIISIYFKVKKSLKINNEIIDPEVVFSKLDHESVKRALDGFKKANSPINNFNRYALATLYNIQNAKDFKIGIVSRPNDYLKKSHTCKKHREYTEAELEALLLKK